jgi:mono/diheme cytochrome c family protein
VHLIQKNDPTIDLYLIGVLGKWSSFSDATFSPFLYELLERYSDPIVYEAVVSSLAGREEIVMRDSITPELNMLLSNAIENRKMDKKNWIFEKVSVEEDDRSRGMRFYKTICASCHGSGGAGMEGLAPPLRGSEYVLGSEERLALIILHGLKGPVHVNGIRYEFNTEMPGIATNVEMSDQDITDLIIYLSNAFGTSGTQIDAKRIKELRKIKPASGGAFTEEELNALKQ